MAPCTAKNSSGILKNLRNIMRSTKYVTELLDGYIVPMEDAHQSEYIADCDKRVEFVSGFSGSRAIAAITQKEAALWTDGRYFLQASIEMDENWILMKEGLKKTPTLEKWLQNSLPHGGSIGVNPFLVSERNFNTISKELKLAGISLVPVVDNLIDKVWGAERPADPANSLIVLPVELTGASWQSKIERIRTEMVSNNSKLLVLTALDEIAWTFNLRGSDIDFNPVFFAYAIISLDFVSLFISQSKATTEVYEHLNVSDDDSNDVGDAKSLNVKVLPYSAIRDYLSQYVKESLEKPVDKIWLPGATTSQAIASIVSEDRRLTKQSPVAMMKAMKNSVEVAGMRNAHLRDAVAHCEFLYCLEKQMSKPGDSQLTELSVADLFASLRREQFNFVSESFHTISAFGPHAAQCHYRATADSDATLSRDQIYLVDSGAQYRDGTTDVTRTICFDQPTDFQKECFTLVLKGHIALATQKFPVGTSGMRLDSITRSALWNSGLDYRHGTGHGVGHFLNVHEGPCGIGYRSGYGVEGITENMVITIEPGYYEDGQFGIRIENVYVTVPVETRYRFQETQFLTFDPLTLVPIQNRMLDGELLTDAEITWLNEYHAMCLDKVGPMLEAQGKHDTYKWLEKQCKPLG